MGVPTVRRATRRLLRLRPGSELRGQPPLISREWAQVNECSDNSLRESRETGNTVVSGWLVGEYRGGFTPVMFHFWNQDPEGRDYDVTPGIQPGEYEYVRDDQVFDHAYEFSKLNYPGWILFPPSMKFRDRTVEITITPRDSLDQFRWCEIPEQPIMVRDLMQWRDQWCRKLGIDLVES